APAVSTLISALAAPRGAAAARSIVARLSSITLIVSSVCASCYRKRCAANIGTARNQSACRLWGGSAQGCNAVVGYALLATCLYSSILQVDSPAAFGGRFNRLFVEKACRTGAFQRQARKGGRVRVELVDRRAGITKGVYPCSETLHGSR